MAEEDDEEEPAEEVTTEGFGRCKRSRMTGEALNRFAGETLVLFISKEEEEFGDGSLGVVVNVGETREEEDEEEEEARGVGGTTTTASLALLLLVLFPLTPSPNVKLPEN